MIETQATVTAQEGDYALVEANQGGCGRCHEQGGCGGNNASRLFCHGPRHFRVLNPLGVKVGEKVLVGVPDGAVSHSVLVLYLLPLALLVLGAVAGAALMPGARDAAAAAGALSGGCLAWFLARRLQARNAHSPRFQPVVRQRL